MTTENLNPEPTAEELAAQAAADEAKAPLSLDGAAPNPNPNPTAAKPDGEEKPAKADEVVVVQYNPTGDAGLDMTLKFVGDLGYAPDHPAMAAAIGGDFTMLKAELTAKGVKGAEAYIELGQQAYARTKAATEKRMADDRKAVTDAVGGEAEWVKVQAWAKENATPEEAKEISAELAAGGFRAKAAAAFLRTQYDRATGAPTDGEGKPVAAVKGAAESSGALSPREYAKAVANARVGFKGDFENSAVYKGLQARRMAYRG